MERTTQLLTASNFVCWPDPGGWMDQDGYLVDDVIRYLNYRDWLKAQNPDIRDQPPPEKPIHTVDDLTEAAELAGMKVEILG